VKGKRLLFVTSGLARGGAEGFLERLAGSLRDRGHTCAVASLGRDEPLAATIAARGIAVFECGRGTAGPAWRLRRIAREFAPDAVQGWMYRGNIASAWAARRCKTPPILVWSVRQGLGDLDASPWTTKLAVGWNARWSERPAAIVYNAYDAARQHEAAGFVANRTRVIPNGIQVAAFVRDGAVRERTRAALGLTQDHVLVAMFARFHPVKNHKGFIDAAGIVAKRRRDVRFLLAGAGVDETNAVLAGWLDEAGIRDRVRLLGERSDVADLLAASDVATLSSHAESLPNAVLEGMAAGLVVVAPALGDIPGLVGDAGIIVRAGNPAALAEGWERAAAMHLAERRAFGLRARTRASERFDIDRATDAYEALYESTGNS
jgi:glycosyltransferase involved in cell wall biosynthesis